MENNNYNTEDSNEAITNFLWGNENVNLEDNTVEETEELSEAEKRETAESKREKAVDEIYDNLYDRSIEIKIDIKFSEDDEDVLRIYWNWVKFKLNKDTYWYQEQIKSITISWYTFDDIQTIFDNYTWRLHITMLLNLLKNNLRDSFNERMKELRDKERNERRERKRQKTIDAIERLEEEEREAKRLRKEKLKELKELNSVLEED